MIGAQEILDFWFLQAGKKNWYNGGDAFDALIRERFEDFLIDLVTDLRANGQHVWEENAGSALALIISLDQFPRNMYRGTKGAFAFDALALSASKRAIDCGHDLKVSQDRRAFFYMPYMHSEQLGDQDECVRLADMRLDNPSTLHHAKEHRKLISKFGRFPHRNDTLGRQSTSLEQAFLNSGGYSP